MVGVESGLRQFRSGQIHEDLFIFLQEVVALIPTGFKR